MRKRYTIAEFDTHMPIQCTMHQLGYIDSHTHHCFEIDLVLSGRCTVVVNGQSYNLGPEDVISIDTHTPHEIRSTDCILISIHFEQSLFDQTLPNHQHPQFFCNSAVQGDNASFQTLRRLIARLVKNNAHKHLGYELRNWSMIYELMDELYNHFRIDSSYTQDSQSHRYATRVTQIARIVRERHTEALSLSDLADMVHLSVPYLSKFFNQQFGMTFLSYLTQVRLDHAVNDLLNTEKTLEEISADTGFPNNRAFVQAFKKEYGVLPSVYRRQSQREKPDMPAPLVIEHHDYMSILKKYLEPLSQTSVAPDSAFSHSIYITESEPSSKLCHTWRNVITINNASDLLFGDVQNMVRKTQRDIGYKYIKFNGILSDDLHVYNLSSDGTVIYNFIYIDKIFDFLMSIGLRPIIQFSFMPRQLAVNPTQTHMNYLVSKPNSMDSWQDLIDAVMKHLVNRYGLEEVSQWYFGAWHMPDTPGSMFGFDDTQTYLDLYHCTYSVVKNYNSKIYFGAPPTSYIIDEDYRNWYIDFLSWCESNHCMPDFLNFCYCEVSDSTDGLSTFIDQVSAEQKALHLEHLPVLLTEWQHTSSQNDRLNDTCFQSCYLVKNILENYDRIDSFGCRTLTDWVNEAPLPKELFFGGAGLFTMNGIPKASYRALELLRQLGDHFIGKGEGWFATKRGKKYVVLLYNYRHFPYLSAQSKKIDTTFIDHYTSFFPTQNLDLHIFLTDMENGKYLVRETILNHKSGSAFDQWLEMGTMELDTEQELKALEALSIPHYNKYVAEAKDHTLELGAILESLEVRLLVIEPEK